MEKIELVENTNKIVSYMGQDGNIYTEEKSVDKSFLRSEERGPLTLEYDAMNGIDDDHYAVGLYSPDLQYGSGIKIAHLKWGIIRLSRDENGHIVPQGETLVVPYVYGEIISSNLQTARCRCKGKYTYVDLNPSRDSYGQQLVPCLLEIANRFNNSIEGFALCSFANNEFYLPRNAKPKKDLAGAFLTQKEAILLRDYLAGENSVDEARRRYEDLTGESVEQAKQYKKK